MVTTVDTRKRFMVTLVKVSMFKVSTKKNIIPKSMDMVVKYGGLSSLLVNS